LWGVGGGGGGGGVSYWPLHNTTITNSVWHVLKLRVVGGNTILRNRVGGEGEEYGAHTRGVFAIIGLVFVRRPRTKKISCKGQVL